MACHRHQRHTEGAAKMRSIDLIRDVTVAANPPEKTRKLRKLITAIREGTK